MGFLTSLRKKYKKGYFRNGCLKYGIGSPKNAQFLIEYFFPIKFKAPFQSCPSELIPALIFALEARVDLLYKIGNDFIIIEFQTKHKADLVKSFGLYLGKVSENLKLRGEKEIEGQVYLFCFLFKGSILKEKTGPNPILVNPPNPLLSQNLSDLYQMIFFEFSRVSQANLTPDAATL